MFHGTLLDTGEKNWDTTFDINVKSMFHTSKACISMVRGGEEGRGWGGGEEGGRRGKKLGSKTAREFVLIIFLVWCSGRRKVSMVTLSTWHQWYPVSRGRSFAVLMVPRRQLSWD